MGKYIPGCSPSRKFDRTNITGVVPVSVSINWTRYSRLVIQFAGASTASGYSRIS